MTSVQLVQAIDTYINRIERSQMLSILNEINVLWITTFEQMAKTITIGDVHEANRNNEESRKVSSRIKTVLKKHPTFTVAENVRMLQAGMELLSKEFVHGGIDTHDFSSIAVDFLKVYDECVREQDDIIRRLTLFRVSETLLDKLNSDTALLTTIRDNLIPEIDIPSDFEVASFHFDGDFTVQEVGTKMEDLVGIYDIVCRMGEVDPDAHPMKIIKIETGTLEIAIAGMLIAKVAELIVMYARANSIKTRNQDWIDEQFAASESMEQLWKRKKEDGEYTPEDARHRFEIGLMLAANMKTFISGHTLTVNGQSTVVQPMAPGRKPIIRSRKTPLLGDSKQEDQ